MSVQEALHFIQKVRADESLREEIQRLQQEAGLKELVEIGKGAGLQFTEAHLRTAFGHDWAMRWFRAMERQDPQHREEA